MNAISGGLVFSMCFQFSVKYESKCGSYINSQNWTIRMSMKVVVNIR